MWGHRWQEIAWLRYLNLSSRPEMSEVKLEYNLIAKCCYLIMIPQVVISLYSFSTELSFGVNSCRGQPIE